MKSQQSFHVVLTFSGPQKKTGHYVYSIVGTDKNGNSHFIPGEFNTVRRYSDFNVLRTTLSVKYPGFYIPALPQKKFLNNEDSTFIELRKFGLSYFIHTLKTLQNLWYSQETQLFLRKIGDVSKELQDKKDTNMNQILQRYKQQIPSHFDKQVPKQLSIQITDFGQYLKKAKGLLENLENMAQQIFNSRKKVNEKYLNLLQSIIPEYETNCMEVYRNENNFEELIFTGSKKQKILPFLEEFRKKKNSALVVLSEIRREKEEILGFEEVLKKREEYISMRQKAQNKVKELEMETTKIHSGKESLMSKIKGKSREEQLKENEAGIKKTEDEERNLRVFCDVLSWVIGEGEIKRFKNLREKAYYVMVRRVFELEREEGELKRGFWGLVLRENHEKEELDNFFDSSPLKNEGKHEIEEEPGIRRDGREELNEEDEDEVKMSEVQEDEERQEKGQSRQEDKREGEEIKEQNERIGGETYQIE